MKDKLEAAVTTQAHIRDWKTFRYCQFWQGEKREKTGVVWSDKKNRG